MYKEYLAYLLMAYLLVGNAKQDINVLYFINLHVVKCIDEAQDDCVSLCP